MTTTRRTVLLLALMLVARRSAPAQEKAAPPQHKVTPAQLNGEWAGTLVLDNSSPRVTMVFDVTDSTFAGKVYDDGTLMGPMENGSIAGNRVHFMVDRFDFTCVVTGSRMKIDLIVYNGSTRSFSAVKSP